MASQFLFFLSALLILCLLGFLGLRRPAGSPIRVFAGFICIVCLLSVAFFCAFGFLASFESSVAADRLRWQIGYGFTGVSALYGVARIALRSLRKAA
jgi:hypothetical protein